MNMACITIIVPRYIFIIIIKSEQEHQWAYFYCQR